MSIRAMFVEHFDEANAQAIENAAEGHKNGVHDDKGSDPFKWALCIAIGYECVTKYRSPHGITADPDELKDWIRWNADLGTHDGDIDYLAAMAGAYDGWYNPDAATWTAAEAES